MRLAGPHFETTHTHDHAATTPMNASAAARSQRERVMGGSTIAGVDASSTACIYLFLAITGTDAAALATRRNDASRALP